MQSMTEVFNYANRTPLQLVYVYEHYFPSSHFNPSLSQENLLSTTHVLNNLCIPNELHTLIMLKSYYASET